MVKKVVTLHIHPAAPAKPPEGQTCNGCGVCCLAEPCPLGSVLTLRASGACRLLRWSDADRRYYCGVLQRTHPQQVDPLTHPWRHRWHALLNRTAQRWIAAGEGCDCTMEDVPPEGGM